MGYIEFHPRHVDPLTQYIAQVDSDHAYIHKGWAYTYQNVITLAGNASKSCILQTPASLKDIHFRPLLIGTSASPVKLEFNEGPTYTGGSDESADIWNRNRKLKTLLPLSKIIDGTVTITDAGTPLPVYYIGSGTRPSNVSGGAISSTEEILLDQDEEYMIRVTNQTSTSTQLTIGIFWYEEDEYHD